MWYRPTSPYVISTESQGWLIVRALPINASSTCNNWYQPDPHSQFNIPPYVFIYCHEIPLHVNGIAAADEFASFPFQKRRDGPGDPIWVWWWYILYHDTSYTPFALKCFSTTGTILPIARNTSHINLGCTHLCSSKHYLDYYTIIQYPPHTFYLPQ